MKKIIAILVIALGITGALFADGTVGLNLKGMNSDVYPAPFLEVGYDTGRFGVYGQLGFQHAAGLAGVTMNMPDSPFFAFVGTGLKAVNKVSTSTTKITDKESIDVEIEYINASWRSLTYASIDVSYTDLYKETTVSKTYSTSIAPFMEAGLGISAGPVYTKFGWSNFDGHTFTMSGGFNY